MTTKTNSLRESIRVLMIARQFYPWIGGTERQALKLSRALIAQGVDVKVVTGWWFRDTPQQEVIEGVPVFRNFTMWQMFDIRGLRKFGAYLYLITLLGYLWRHRHKYDVIHIHQLNYHAFAAVLAGKWFSKKTIIKIANSGSHSDMLKMKQNTLIPGTRYMLPTTLQADYFIALAKVIVKELQAVGIPSKKIIELPNGVEVNNIPSKKDYELHKLVSLIFVGRLHPQKRVDKLLLAFKQAMTARPNLVWQLLLLGDGVLRQTLETMAEDIGCADEVIFWGQTDNVQTYLAQADIFILPSRAEGMSNALLEAMSHGLPCIAGNEEANQALVCHGKNGLLIDCEDPGLLAQAIMDLADDIHLRQQLGKAARRTIEDRFAIEHVAQQYIAVYRGSK